MEIYGYVASLVMGITLGLIGGGGSILTVPILVYLFNTSPSMATGYSLLIVGMTALIGAFSYIKKKDFALKVAITFALPSFLGVSFSRVVVLRNLPEIILSFNKYNLTKDLLIMLCFSIIMVMASYFMIRTKKSKQQMDAGHRKPFLLMSLQAFLVGSIAGFVGAGGGFLIVPSLVFFANLGMRAAIGTSLSVIAFQSLLGFSIDAMTQEMIIDWKLLFSIASISAVGIILGSAFAHKVSEGKLKSFFGWFVLVMGLMIMLEQLQHF